MTNDQEIQSIHRATRLLLFLASSNDGKTFTEIRTAADMGKSTAHRFLSTLESAGLVRRSDERYYLGLVALRIGMAAGNQLELRTSVRPFLTELASLTGETSNLVVLDGHKPVFIDNVESSNNLRIYSRLGRHTSPYATSAGKALLAFQPPGYLQEVLANVPFEKRTGNTITSEEAFRKELELVRHRGYAVDDEEGEVGARCVGAPILGMSGNAIAALSVAGPSARVTRERVAELAAIVISIAKRAQKALGIQLPEPPHAQLVSTASARDGDS